MQIIHWEAFNPTGQEIEQSTKRCQGMVHLRSLCQALVRSALESYPWVSRPDIAPLFDPSRTYQAGEPVAFPRIDPQEVRPDSWQVETVKAVLAAENPIQGAFQVVTFEQGGRIRTLATGITSAEAADTYVQTVRFPPEDPEELDWLVSDFTDRYYPALFAVVQAAIQAGRLPGRLLGDQVWIESGEPLIGDEEAYYLEEILKELSPCRPVLVTADILARLRDLGGLTQSPDETATFALELALEEAGCIALGNHQWTTPTLWQMLDRELTRRMQVPAIRSRLSREWKVDEGPALTIDEQSALAGQDPEALTDLGAEPAADAPALGEWSPPGAPLALPALTALHIYQGYFPLTAALEQAFNPIYEPLLAHIQIVEGEPLPFWVSRSERVLKAWDGEALRLRFQDLDILAGMNLWLEFQGGFSYRLAPRRLPAPHPVPCKLAYLNEAGRLVIETVEIPMLYDGRPHLFKAELRHNDVEALFREAEQSGLSIFDAMVAAFEQLRELHPEGLVHHSDLFNTVFFQHRMCSPNTVLAELYSRPCFVASGEGYFRLDLNRGIRRFPRHRAAVPQAVDSQRQPATQHVTIQPTPDKGPEAELPTTKTSGPTLAVLEPPASLTELPAATEVAAPAEPEPKPSTDPAKAGPAGTESDELIPEVPDTASAAAPAPEPAVPAGMSRPSLTRRGQYIAPGLIPQGPLFDSTANCPIRLPALARVNASTKGHPEMQIKTLFSKHFLDTRLTGQPEWNEDPILVLEQVRGLWRKASQYSQTWNEAQTEREFIQPVLDVLGWSYIVQTKSQRGGQVTRPDYALFNNEDNKNAAYPHQGNDAAFYSRAIAIGEAKHWGRSLSQKDASGRATWKAESNPSHQMVSYLNGTRAEWGLLTNGRVWRLYSREVSSVASEFYEIDLADLFDFLPDGVDPTPDQMEHFKRWWLFFRKAAFTRQTNARSFVERIQAGSATYAREISEKLKDLVFKEVMPEIAGGFVAYRHLQVGTQGETLESLQEIYRASLSLLYKLLFLLYAEARALLPMDNPDYRANSLTHLAEWAAEQHDTKRNLSAATYATPHYDALLALFRRVDQGDPALGIPRYNGGLFSPTSIENRFLEAHKLSDLAVARAIDLLVRDQGQPVDYAYISVRNLGAIYEGLLENRLSVIDAAQGQVILVNDKGERKATGSYYTPDYIVEYIVAHSLDPILDARCPVYETAMQRVSELRKLLFHTVDAVTNHRLQGELAEAERQAREAFLGIKVLDPAMGSGHFLVNAVDHLTDGIILRMQAYHDTHPKTLWEWDPIQQLIERVRAEILAEMAAQGLQVDARRLDDTALLTRLVMKRCIYGVDLNRMAVELAKVSLWLHSFTVGAPLSFLDHHLRWGNSLVGADVRTVEAALRAQEQKGGAMQFNLFAGPFAGLLDLTAMMIDVAERADATLADVRQSAQEYETLQRALIPYKQILDLWVSQFFDNKAGYEFLTLFGGEVLPTLQGKGQVATKYRQAIETASQLWQEKRFFHWDLEFPEVFVDLHRRDWAENGGFDAVIGNPPYDELSEDARGSEIDEMEFLQSSEVFRPAVGHRINLYRLFIAQSTHVLAEQGTHGFIIPISLLADQFTFELRKYLLHNTSILLIEQFPQKDDPRNRVFPEAKLSTCLYVLRKTPSIDNEVKIRSHPGKFIEPDSPQYQTFQANFTKFDPDNLSIPGLSQVAWNLVLALATNPNLVRLGDVMFSQHPKG